MTELLAPINSMETLSTAIQSGANSVYFGTTVMNMRQQAGNFEINQFSKIADICRNSHVKTCLTLNTIVFDHELHIAERIIKHAKSSGIDAVICWDPAVISLALKYDMEVHLSTQAGVANFETLRFYHSMGCRRFVLARELSLEQIAGLALRIRKHKLDADLEVFGHGAMCVSVSGRCFLSHFLENKSANRGECLQHCRREYAIRDMETGSELILGNNFILSARDLCSLPVLPRLVGSGITALKIEGRMKSSDYVSTVLKVYREGLDLIKERSITCSNDIVWQKFVREGMEKLKQVFNRGFHTGFLENLPTGMITDEYGSKATVSKHYSGIVKRFLKRIMVMEVMVHSRGIKTGDKLAVAGKRTGFQEFTVHEMQKDDVFIQEACKGDFIGIKIDFPVRPGDKVFVLEAEAAAPDVPKQ